MGFGLRGFCILKNKIMKKVYLFSQKELDEITRIADQMLNHLKSEKVDRYSKFQLTILANSLRMHTLWIKEKIKDKDK